MLVGRRALLCVLASLQAYSEYLVLLPVHVCDDCFLHLVCSDSTRTETKGTPEAHSFKLEAFGLSPTM